MPKRTAHVFEDKWRSDDVKQQEAADFSSLLLSEKVLLGLKKAGFKTPSPIQLEAIPVGRVGNDLIVQAKSGTGKTLVFTIIALDLLKEKKHPQTLILAPTREIAFQICEVIKSVSSTFKYLKCGAFIGGIPIEEDRQNILGCQIVVGTPGRIKQLIQLRVLLTAHIRLFVLDEADQLLEKSFQSDIDAIFVSLPTEKQIITTSATYPKSLKKLVDKYFKQDPYVARLNVNDRALLGTKHYIKIVEVNPMPVLAYKAKMRALENVLTSVNFSQCLVFCNAVSKVEPICDDIKSWGFSATYISSAKEQTARLKAIECLKRFKCKVLVSSDVTSRGIDAENVDLIVNCDVPNSPEVYLHRVGRAGRFGSKGLAVTFIQKDQIATFTNIQKKGNFKAYFLPDPIPGNLIDVHPDQEAESLREESISESSEEEPITPEKKSHKSNKIANGDHVSNGKTLSLYKDQSSQNNSLNSQVNVIEKDSSYHTIAALSQSSASEISLNENMSKLDGSAITNNAVNSKSKDIAEKYENNLHSKLNGFVADKENTPSSVDMSLESVKDEGPLQLPIKSKDKFSFELGSSSSESKEYLEIIESSDNSPKDMDISTDGKSSCFTETKEMLKVTDVSEINLKDLDSDEAAYLSDKLRDNENGSEVSIGTDLKDDSSDRNADMVVLESVLTQKPEVLQDTEINALKNAVLVSNKNELMYNVELNSNVIDVEVSKLKTTESSAPNTICTNSTQIDEVTGCVINFIHSYEKKNESKLNGDIIIPKETELNLGETKFATEELVLHRKSLSDYYYNVYEAYGKENINLDSNEIKELIKKLPIVCTDKENAIQNRIGHKNDQTLAKEQKKHSAIETKIDLNAWSLNLAKEKLDEYDSDSSEDSSDSSSECVRESTPIKTQKIKNASLDVSCDTPSFPAVADESDTSDTSSNSEYSNKCMATLAKPNVDPNSGTSDSESSSSSSDSESETTLLERANEIMLEKDCEKLTLAERAEMLRKVLNDLGKDNVWNYSDESVADIHITTVGQVQEVDHTELDKATKITLNGKSDRQCGFLSSFKGKGKSSTVKMSNNTTAKAFKPSQQKSLQISSASETSSDDSETSSSSASHHNSKKLASNFMKLENLSNSKRSSKVASSSAKNMSTSRKKLLQVSSLSSSTSSESSESSEASSDESECSVSSASRIPVKQRRSKNNYHCRAKSTSCTSSIADDQTLHWPANNLHVNLNGNAQGSCHSHQHTDSCYLPSQHQCHPANSHPHCQSQSCAKWYDLFYRQWNFVQQSPYYYK